MDYKKILVINLGGIGDMVISIPFLRGLRASFPGAELHLLATTSNSCVVKYSAYADRIHAFDMRAARPRDALARPMCLVSALRTVRALWRERYDLAVNLIPLATTSSARKMEFLLAAIGARVLAGRDTSGRGGFYDISVEEDDGFGMYDVRLHALLLTAIGGTPDDGQLELPLSPSDEAEADRVMKELGLNGGDTIIGLNPGSGWPSRRWPVRRYAETVDLLAELPGARFVITGSRGESGLARELASLTRVPVLDTTGRTSVMGMAALVKRLAVMITNDTGPMHVAIAAGTPTVAVIGPGHHRRFLKESGRVEIVRHETGCAPCINIVCENMKCLADITPGEVAGAALRLLGRGGAR
ncbi:MAG: glycosyltransferase family 9 protein [Nitrospirae bacterium]|nr:glycosyltransferase family 9 protein [Nitrospirota bacterium]MBI5694951.1 glycosyltransferase family 9 protein [Nitrospirota bacterium]